MHPVVCGFRVVYTLWFYLLLYPVYSCLVQLNSHTSRWEEDSSASDSIKNSTDNPASISLFLQTAPSQFVVNANTMVNIDLYTSTSSLVTLMISSYQSAKLVKHLSPRTWTCEREAAQLTLIFYSKIILTIINRLYKLFYFHLISQQHAYHNKRGEWQTTAVETEPEQDAESLINSRLI